MDNSLELKLAKSDIAKQRTELRKLKDELRTERTVRWVLVTAILEEFDEKHRSRIRARAEELGGSADVLIAIAELFRTPSRENG